MPIRWSHAAALAAVGVTFAAGCGGSSTVNDRQAAVRNRGPAVMPFDLDRTTHTFAKTAGGGVESVTTRSAGDQAQLPLIREHLRKEQRLFSRGDFRDPMATHGMRMPGLDTLRRHASEINISYHPLPDGAQLRYDTSEGTIRDALHNWFDAQLTDHGADGRG